MRIAIIGPGYGPIPPISHGAVEILIHDLSQALIKLGHEVTIWNDLNLAKVAQEIEDSGPWDFIHIQYENHAWYFAQRWGQTRKYGVTNHYGWFSQRNRWDPGYHQIIEACKHVPYTICLSNEILNQSMFSLGFKDNQLFVLRNGTDTKKFALNPSGNGRILCLGAVERRKNQEFLNLYTDKLDIVGPIRNDGHFELMKGNRYLGEWTKEEIYTRMTEYSALALLSEGEAAPLVIPEAMAAGLCIICSPEASANLPRLPWVWIIDTKQVQTADEGWRMTSKMDRMVEINEQYRKQIKAFAESYFDWSVIATEYIAIVESIIK